MHQRLHWFVIMYVLVIIGESIEFPIIASVIIGLSLYLYYILSFPKWFISLLILFVIGLQTFISVSSGQIPSPPSEMQTIQGTITSMVEQKETYLRFQIQMEDDRNKSEVYYFFNDSPPQTIPSLKTGATCIFTGKFQDIPTARNPGQFDYKNYLLTQGVSSQFILESLQPEHCYGSSAIDAVYHLRSFLLDTVQNKVSTTTYAWIAALLFGDRSHLDEEIVTLFQNWQLSHLLAISGLHVGLLLSIVFFLCLYFFRITVERVSFLMIVCLPFYPFLSGGAPSVWRATLLAIALLLLKKFPLKLSKTDILSIIFLSLVFVNPSIVYSLAFQFSFLVTYSIMFSNKLIFDPQTGNQWIMLRISFISMWIILPIQLHHFYEFHPLSVIINLVVIPYFSLFVLPVLIAILFVIPFSPILIFVDPFFQKVHELFILCLESVDTIWPWSWLFGSFPIYYYVPFYILLGIFFVYFENGKARKAFFSGCMLVAFLMFIAIRPYINPAGYITMLDVGQGDAIVIELPYRKGVIMIDAGGKLDSDFSQASSETYDQIILPFLRSKGINHIDAIFASHADADHIGSIPYILKDYSPDYLITSDYFDQAALEAYQSLSTDTKHLTVRAGDHIKIKEHSFYIHFPSDDQLNRNDNSLVIHSNFGEKDWLFTGDISKNSEGKLVAQSPSLRADVLKVAHHGSNTSTSKDFLKHVKPQYGLISAGQHNRYGHPHNEVLDNLYEQGVLSLRTDKNGAIIYQFTESAGTLFTYLP